MLTYKRKLILTKAQENRINSWIGACRLVYNMGLEIKIAAYKNDKKISSYDLMKQLPTIKDISWMKDVDATALVNVIERLDFSYKTFFRTCNSGGGFPKFKSKKNYKSIVLKQGVTKEKNNVIKLFKLGSLKIFKDSPIIGDIKRAIIKKEIKGYFIYIICDNINRTIQNVDESQVIGLDMGVKYFCIDSNGVFYENPRVLKQHERKLRIEKRSLSRKKLHSKRWYKQVRKVALLEHKIAEIRKDYLHKLSTELAKKYHTIFVEDLNIPNMVKRAKTKQDENGVYLKNNQTQKSGLNKAILDSGWGMFRNMLSYKTEVFRVDPKYTSQTCNECGCVDAVNRVSQSEFKCKECGHTSNADVNAAKNILSKGIALYRQREAVAYA